MEIFSSFHSWTYIGQPTFDEFEAAFSLLKASADHGKTDFLGRYSSPLTSAMSSIVSQWKKNNLHLADSASFLVRGTQFDVYGIMGEFEREGDVSSSESR